ncbi:hypothetical protein N0V84_008984 [Fusarium piperis]|uniref:BTB domain-containing protein n=1 Tax=Fusarium piperis TaxID=1435070 RepID=A0A9W8W755_9HYPO|nr:hypothetical protein N0V84_008984 [Fusarium piperis]
MSSSDNSNVQTIIKNGDVILVIGPEQVKIQLSSSFLCLVSPVFSAMLNTPMSQGQMLKERGDKPVEYSLPEDSAEAASHTFQVLYGSDPKMPHLDPDEIFEVAKFVDKWDMVERFHFASTYWTTLYRESPSVAVERDDCWKLLVASYWFRNAISFSKLSYWMIVTEGYSLCEYINEMEDRQLGLELAREWHLLLATFQDAS